MPSTVWVSIIRMAYFVEWEACFIKKIALIIASVLIICSFAGCDNSNDNLLQNNENKAITNEQVAINHNSSNDNCKNNENVIQNDESDNNDKQSNEEHKFWLISIMQKNTYNLMGLEGEDAIPCENTIVFVAINNNASPYEGEFRGYANIESFTDLKELYEVSNTDYLNRTSKNESKEFTFKLIPSNNLASLTRDENVNPFLSDVASAEFYMALEGDNPASIIGSAEGYSFDTTKKLNYSLTCEISQINDKVELKTDMFGSFEGTIEQLIDDGSRIDIAPLTQGENNNDEALSPEALFDKVKRSFQDE